MKEIKIENLTKHQVHLLSQMWALDTQEEIEQWMETLSKSDRRLATALMRMIVYQMLDDHLEENPLTCYDDMNQLWERVTR